MRCGGLGLLPENREFGPRAIVFSTAAWLN
jgi:hypothetical protein